MFEKLETPEQIFSFKLGAALTMERTVLDMLGELEEKTRRKELRDLFAHHADETREHISRIERSFQLLGEEVDDSPCPAIQGIEKEGQATMKKTDDRLLDAVILADAIETEHHEIAVYETLVTNADARGAGEVTDLLRMNLEEEEHTLEELQEASRRISHEEIAVG